MWINAGLAYEIMVLGRMLRGTTIKIWGVIMTENRSEEKFMARPIEKHDTAAWANIEKTKRISKVTMPSELQVDNAKEHVDSNQK